MNKQRLAEYKEYRYRTRYAKKIKLRIGAHLEKKIDRGERYFPSEFKQQQRYDLFISLFIKKLSKALDVNAQDVDNIISVPKNFSFKEDFDGVMNLFRTILISFKYGKKNIVLHVVY